MTVKSHDAKGGIADIIVRRYEARDLDDVIEIFQRAIREVAAKDYDAEQVAAWSRVEREEWAPHRLSRPAWIAEVDGRSAGFTDLELDGHLDMMYVHPEFQGMGVASALLRELECFAVARDIRRLFTEASITARPFFERRGFRLISEQQVEVEELLLTNFRMEKFLL